MIKNIPLLEKKIIDYLKTQLIVLKKDSVIINFDGTLMSVVNVKLIEKLQKPFQHKIIVCTFNQNKLYLYHLLKILNNDLKVQYEIKDLSNDYEMISPISCCQGNKDLEIAFRKRICDLLLYSIADNINGVVLSNLSYSQWCVNFPHQAYQTLEQIHPLNRLFFSEVKQLARYYNMANDVVEREPSHYLYKGQLDKEVLGFTYQQLEDHLRSGCKITSPQDIIIQNKLVGDNRNRFMGLSISRPSVVLE